MNFVEQYCTRTDLIDSISLEFLVGHPLFGRVTDYLIASTSNVRLDEDIESVLLCYVMLAGPGYSINHNTCRSVTHTTFCILWQYIVAAVTNATGAGATEILMHRTDVGYANALQLKPYQDSDALCVTQRTPLLDRHNRLTQPTVAVSLGTISTDLHSCTGTDYYRSTSGCVCHLLGVPNFWVHNAESRGYADSSTLYLNLNLIVYFTSDPYAGTAGHAPMTTG